MERLDELKATMQTLEQQLAALQAELHAKEEQLRSTFREVMSRTKLGEIDQAKLDEFFRVYPKRPYAIVARRENEALIACPIYIPLNLGWLERQDGAYNIFRVNQYVPLFQPVPADLMAELEFQPRFDGITVQAGTLRIQRPDRDSVDAVYHRYAHYLQKPSKGAYDQLTAKPGQEFWLIAALIRDGILPFTPAPVDPKDLVDRPLKFELRPYQQRDYEEWLRMGVVGLMYPMGAGKSFVPLAAMDRLKGRKLILVRTVTQKEQWREYVRDYTHQSAEEVQVEVYDQRVMQRLKGQEFALVVYDEVHHLGAPTFLQFAMLKTKYRINCTGTPWREDGRHELVLALSGKPLGVDWQYFLAAGYIREPTITVHIARTYQAKLDLLAELLATPGKTMIFCDSLELGHQLSRRFGIPFVSGETKERLGMIRTAEQVIVSRVGDLGISIKDLKRVIEVDFLYGSRVQEAQRIGRLFHARKAGEHHLLMTLDEYQRYQKRLWGIQGKGFRIQLVRHGLDVTALDQPLESRSRAALPRKAPIPPSKLDRGTYPISTRKADAAPVTGIADAVKAGHIPFLSDRAEPSDALLLQVLGCPYARVQQGLRIQDVATILDHFYVRYPKGQWLKHRLNALYDQGKIQGRRESKGVRRYFHEGGS